MTGDGSTGGNERRVRCSCGWQTGWFDPLDAETLADKHLRREHQIALSEVEDEDIMQFKEREKAGQNYSDTLVSLGPPNECDNCGADNVQGQVMCAVCSGMVTEV